jgi:hypothetical protein
MAALVSLNLVFFIDSLSLRTLKFETTVAEIFLFSKLARLIGTSGVCGILDDAVYQIEDQFVSSKQAI